MTKGGVKAFIVFDVAFTPAETKVPEYNWAPIFLKPLQTNFTIKVDDYEEPSFTIELPEIEDDKGLLASIEIQSDIGNSTWTNGTGVESSQDSELTYDYRAKTI